MNAAMIIKRARKSADLSQSALAAAAKTSQPAIAAYESNARQPSVSTLERIVKATGSHLQWTLARGPLADLVHTVSVELGADNQNDALRFVADFSVRLEKRDPVSIASVIADDPGSTGQRKWDALIAGVTERIARRAGLRIPQWTNRPERFAEQFWFVADLPSLQASALVDSPPELANRGVFLHEASLTGL